MSADSKGQLIELATYEDPATIQHETAPTGALYAMPDKKQVGANNHAPPIEPATYQDPATIQHETALTVDLYTVPDKKQGYQAPPIELASYQDPATIQHETAPTGDLYAIPDKKEYTYKAPPTEPLVSATIQHETTPTGDLPNKKQAKQVYLYTCTLTSPYLMIQYLICHNNVMAFYCLKAKIPISSIGQYRVLTEPQQPLYVQLLGRYMAPWVLLTMVGTRGLCLCSHHLLNVISLSLICQSSSKLHPTILLMTLSQRILNRCSWI